MSNTDFHEPLVDYLLPLLQCHPVLSKYVVSGVEVNCTTTFSSLQTIDYSERLLSHFHILH